MANRWETVKTVTDFILGGSKITADGDCSHEIKRRLLLGRKVMINLDSILKSRDRASLVAQLVKNLPAMWGPGFDPWVGKIPWRRERLPTKKNKK